MVGESESRQNRIEELFHAAIETSKAGRAEFLRRACGDDLELLKLLQDLLRFHNEPREFLPSRNAQTQALEPVGRQTSGAGLPALGPAEEVGSVIGHRYHLLEKVGEGTYGTVYMAEQSKPVKRMVALKRLNPGMNSRQVLARFEAERQTLAILDHPNIAKIFDAGQTPNGYPYFVMELVRGVRITDYCDNNELGIWQRLELFTQVCHAVQHAHQKGIIHRDLKPSNVLVANYDSVAIPKVIDFGIAKALGQSLTDQPLFTAFGTVVGTLNYMSPEQATFNAIDVDARSDIYSLGALLYELLTGSPPLNDRLTPEVGFEALLTLIREEEPVKPSTRLSTNAAAPRPAVSAHRGAEWAQRERAVRGDLDWIVMKALAKKRFHRYETATGFARDIDRYLNGEMVEARPPTLGYKAAKFLARHRGPAIAAAVVLLTLAGGIVGTTWGMLRAEGQRQLAEAARQAEQTQRLEATRQAEIARRQKETAEAAAGRAFAFSEILNRSLMMGNPFNASGSPETMSDLLTNVAAEIDAHPDLPADVRGPIDSFVARAMITQGQSARAAERSDEGLRLTLQSLPADSLEVLRAELIDGMTHVIAKDYAEARKHLDRVASAIETAHATLSDRADLLSARTILAYGERNLELAAKLAGELVELLKGQSPDRVTPALIVARVMLSIVTSDGVNKQGSLRLSQENAQDAARILGPEHGLTLLCGLLNGVAMFGAGNPDGAEPLLANLLPRLEKVYGNDHAMVGAATEFLGLIYQLQGKTEQARTMLARAKAIGEKWASTPGLGRSEFLLMTAAATGDLKQFVEALKRVDSMNPSTQPGPGGFDFRKTIEAFGQATQLMNAGTVPGVETILEPVVRAIPPLGQLRPEQQIICVYCRFLLCLAYTQTGKAVQADQLSKKWLLDSKAHEGIDPRLVIMALGMRCTVLLMTGKPAECLSVLDTQMSLPGARTDPYLKNLDFTIRGLCLASLHKDREAEPLLLDALVAADANPAQQLFPQYRVFLIRGLMEMRSKRGDWAGVDEIAAKFHLPQEMVPLRPEPGLVTPAAPSTDQPANHP